MQVKGVNPNNSDNMITDFIIGVMLMGSLFHLSFALWKVKVLSPFGSSTKANGVYGIFVLCISLGLYLYKYGTQSLFENQLYLGGLFALAYTIIFGLIVNRKIKNDDHHSKLD